MRPVLAYELVAVTVITSWERRRASVQVRIESPDRYADSQCCSCGDLSEDVVSLLVDVSMCLRE